MKKILSILSIFSVIFLFAQKNFQNNSEYHFYENKGQIVDQDGKPNNAVKYLFHSNGLNVQLRKGGFSYDVYEVKKTPNPHYRKPQKNDLPQKYDFNLDKFKYENIYHRIDIELINSNPDAKIVAENKSKDYDNYFNISHNPKGVTNVHKYQKVIYKNIYRNVDLVFFKPKDTLKPIEYNFIIHPGGKVSDIRMKFNGAETKILDNTLDMDLRFGKMQENIPQSWIAGNKRENINVSFKDLGDQTFGFHSPVNTSEKTIIIDPVPTRIWGSYAGGGGDESGRIKTDSQNTVYLYGATNSLTNFATSGTYQQNNSGQFDGYIMKITKHGQKIWGTFFGTPRDDNFSGIDFDENFNIYAGGEITRQATNTDVFLAKFDINGSLIYQKDFIGNIQDDLFTVSYNDNQVFLGGSTRSSNYPVLNAYQPNKLSINGYSDAFLTSINAVNGDTVWSSYFGGSDFSTGITDIFSSNNDLEIIGQTTSPTILMINPFQASFQGVSDALYLKFSKSGILLRSSYIGNTIQDQVFSARIIGDMLILAGEFPNYNGPVFGPAGIWRVNLTTNVISKSILNLQSGMGYNAYVDSTGKVFFYGLHTNGLPDVSTPGAYLGMPPFYISSYFVKYNQNDVKEWGTYYTGNGATQHGHITKDNENYLYFTGMSSGNTSGIATLGTFQQSIGGLNDLYIAKFQDCTSSGMVSSNSPICTNSTLNLTASGGTTYSWTGPNGFTSNLQNPTIPNASSANAGVYTCAISGSGSCDGSFTVNVIVGDNLAPVPNQATLPMVTGDCNMTISSFPTATDNCAGTITATTADPLSYYTPGTYTIHWSYNDGNGNISTQNQNVTVSLPATPTTTSNQQVFCASDQPTLSDVQISGQNIVWTDVTGNVIFANNPPLVNGETYYAYSTVNGCQSNTISIQVTVNNTPLPIANTNQDFCASANPTLANLIVNGTALIFYDAAGNVLPLTTPLVNGQIYYVTQTLNACKSDKLAITVTHSQNNVPATNYRETLCNVTTAMMMTVNLNSYQSNMIANPANYIFTYTNQAGNPILNPSSYILNLGSNIINVKVATADGCFKNVILELVLNPKPSVTLPEDFHFCEGKSVILDAGSGFVTYLWNTGATTQTITVSIAGTYSVKVTNSFGCENTDNIVLSYSTLAQITAVNITGNTAAVIVSPSGIYEYSLDNASWQDSNIFTQLEMGEYTVYVRTKDGCFIGQKPFSIFNIPNAISPNGDGVNESWKIAGLQNYKGSEVSVYDRKGALVFRQIINKTPLEWNGKINGAPVPTGNYWYTIKVSDGRNYSGWLLIKNRN